MYVVICSGAVTQVGDGAGDVQEYIVHTCSTSCATTPALSPAVLPA